MPGDAHTSCCALAIARLHRLADCRDGTRPLGELTRERAPPQLWTMHPPQREQSLQDLAGAKPFQFYRYRNKRYGMQPADLLLTMRIFPPHDELTPTNKRVLYTYSAEIASAFA